MGTQTPMRRTPLDSQRAKIEAILYPPSGTDPEPDLVCSVTNSFSKLFIVGVNGTHGYLQPNQGWHAKLWTYRNRTRER